MLSWVQQISDQILGQGSKLGDVILDRTQDQLASLRRDRGVSSNHSSAVGNPPNTVPPDSPFKKQANAQLQKRARFFADSPARKKLGLQEFYTKEAQKMSVQSRAWGIDLAQDNPVHFLMGLSQQFHSEAEMKQAYQKIGHILDEIHSDPTIKDLSPQQKLQKAYQIIEKYYEYSDTDHFVEGILTGILDCDTQSILLITIAHEEKWPVSMVYCPQHAFIRWDDGQGTRFNLEIGGKILTDEDYQKKFGVSKNAVKKRVFLSSLNQKELEGHFFSLTALKYLEEGEQGLAIKFYDQAIQAHPLNYFALNNRLRIYHRQGDFSKFLKDLTFLHRLLPQDIQLSSLLSIHYFEEGQYQLAEEVLVGALFKDGLPADFQLQNDPKEKFLLLAAKIILLVYDKAHALDPLQAEKYLNMALDLFNILPKKEQAKFEFVVTGLTARLGLISYLNGKVLQAFNYCKEFQRKFRKIKESPDISKEVLEEFEKFYGEMVSLLLAKIHLKWEEGKKALVQLEKAQSLNPKNSDIFYDLGRAHYFNDQFKKAKPYLEKAAKIFPDNLEILQFLGETHYELRNFSKAKDIFEKIIQMDSENGVAKVMLAYTLYDLKKPSEALVILQNLVTQDPQNTNFLQALAWVQVRQKQFESAKKIYQGRLDKDPKDFYSISGLGWVYLGMGDYTTAKIYFENALKQNEIIRKESAGILTDVCLKAGKEDWEAYHGLGMVHFHRKDYEMAHHYLKSAYELRPQDSLMIEDYRRVKAAYRNSIKNKDR